MGYDECLDALVAAGRRPGLIKCRDNFGAIDGPLARWPEIVTIGAVTEWDDASFGVAEAYDNILRMARKNPGIKYWEYFNEMNGQYERQADFYIDLMLRLQTAGVGLCMFNSPSGAPQYAELDPVPYREIARAAAFAKVNKCDVIIGQHEYAPPEGQAEADHLGRYKRLAEYLSLHNALLPIAITEWGWEVCGDQTQAYFEWMKRVDAVYMGDDRVIGTAAWVLGGGGWGASNYQRILPKIGAYMAAVEPPAPPQPVIPPIVPHPNSLEARMYMLESRVALLEAQLTAHEAHD